MANDTFLKKANEAIKNWVLKQSNPSERYDAEYRQGSTRATLSIFPNSGHYPLAWDYHAYNGEELSMLQSAALMVLLIQPAKSSDNPTSTFLQSS